MSRLRLVESPRFATIDDVEHVLAESRQRHVVLLLTESSECIPKVKPGLSALAYRVLDETTAEGGPLDQMLRGFIGQRPRLSYHRLFLDRRNAQVMTRLGVTWLPQVRVIKNERILFRSSVSIGDNGQFLAQDVGGRSFVRRTDPGPGGLINLSSALSAELDRLPPR